MELTWQDLAFHHHIAGLIDALDGAQFWTCLTRTLKRSVEFDNWVALLFSNDCAPLLCAESPMPDGTVDLLFQAYLDALYQLDPFYISACERPASGLVTLASVAPDNFCATDYYQRYFKRNIVGDEVHFNCVLDGDRTLALSLGATNPYSERDLARFALIAPWVVALMRQRVPYEGFSQAHQVADRQAAGEAQAIGFANRFARIAQESGRTQLTAREVEVVRLSLGGFSTRTIAERLAISFETVRAHKKHVYAKLGVRSQSELFALLVLPK